MRTGTGLTDVRIRPKIRRYGASHQTTKDKIAKYRVSPMLIFASMLFQSPFGILSVSQRLMPVLLRSQILAGGAIGEQRQEEKDLAARLQKVYKDRTYLRSSVSYYFLDERFNCVLHCFVQVCLTHSLIRSESMS